MLPVTEQEFIMRTLLKIQKLFDSLEFECYRWNNGISTFCPLCKSNMDLFVAEMVAKPEVFHVWACGKCNEIHVSEKDTIRVRRAEDFYRLLEKSNKGEKVWIPQMSKVLLEILNGKEDDSKPKKD